MSAVSTDYRVVSLLDCFEVAFKYFWKSGKGSSEPVPTTPTVDDVLNKMVENNAQKPYVLQVDSKGCILFAWIDLDHLESTSFKPVNETETATTTASVMPEDDDPVRACKKIMNSRVNAISHVFEVIKKVCANIEKCEEKSAIQKQDMMYGVKKNKISKAIMDAKTIPAVKEQDEQLKPYAEAILQFVKTSKFVDAFCAMAKYIINPGPIPHPDPDEIAKLKKQLEEKDKIIEDLKKQIEGLKPQSTSPIFKPPEVSGKTYVFKHPANCDDKYVYLMRTDQYRFDFFYLDKEWLEKEAEEKKLDLTKDITCTIRGDPVKYTSNENEKEITAKYHVRLGVDFHLCKGDLSQP